MKILPILFPLISWTSFESHQFCGHAALLAVKKISTFLWNSKKDFQEQEQQKEQQISRSYDRVSEASQSKRTYSTIRTNLKLHSIKIKSYFL